MKKDVAGWEFKSHPNFTKEISGRMVTGIAAVFGNVDLGGDRLHPGAFTKTLKERQGRFRFLWNHNFAEPPIAVIRALREVGRDQLPAQVLARAPEATGGLEVTREYLDTPRGNEVLEALKGGIELEMSFGYEAIKWSYSEAPHGHRIRELREVRLYDLSDVLWGMNAATVAAKSLQAWLEQMETAGHTQPQSRADSGEGVGERGSRGAYVSHDSAIRNPQSAIVSLTRNQGDLYQLELFLTEVEP